jgi:hypothetical protein
VLPPAKSERLDGWVQALVDGCLASPVIARALAAKEHWCEVPFTIPWEEGLAVGRIDLLFVEDE